MKTNKAERLLILNIASVRTSSVFEGDTYFMIVSSKLICFTGVEKQVTLMPGGLAVFLLLAQVIRIYLLT